MITFASLRWTLVAVIVLIVAVVTALSLEEAFEKASPPSPPPQPMQRMAATVARTVGLVIALIAIMSAVFIAIIHILRGRGSDVQDIPNCRPQAAGRQPRMHSGHGTSPEEIHLPTLRARAPNNPYGGTPADSVDTLPVYDTERPPNYSNYSKGPDALRDEVSEPSARPLPLATGDEEEIDLGTVQAIPHIEVANPINTPPAVRVNPRVLER